LESLSVGAIGWIGGVVNVLPKSHVRLYELAVIKQHYEAARKLFFRMLPTLELMEGGGKYTQFVKAACGLQGHPVGPPRRPLKTPPTAEQAQLRTKRCSQAALTVRPDRRIACPPGQAQNLQVQRRGMPVRQASLT